mmetsp:Transcript_21624/g.38835  ORF Transcript_21624/g.38835 Transcript_21624/m.38835 type:complete len:83 (+) Transcript_21624:1577-1825(+)
MGMLSEKGTKKEVRVMTRAMPTESRASNTHALQEKISVICSMHRTLAEKALSEGRKFTCLVCLCLCAVDKRLKDHVLLMHPL